MTTTTALSALERLEIREACERLALDYSHLADTGQLEAFSRLFADDGDLVIFGQTFTGPAAILKAVGAGRSPTAMSVHAISNLRIDVTSEDTAEGTIYILAFTGEKKDGGPATVARIAPAMVGVYHDRYRRTASGWKFARRAFEPLIATQPEG